MRIEVAKEGRMDMSGKGLIRAIQNNNMPLLDLFVRESVQNSLDAFKKGADVVRVDFGIKNFNNVDLARKLEGVEEALLQKFGGEECKYLYIRDRGTEGLTGPLHFSDRSNSDTKNLLKLVYEIAKPQEGKGAGGSWGYGKTVYFRIGVGIVIYYSRIKEKNGEYQSRLAACLVEDENKADALLRAPSLNSHRGLAWWGKEFEFESNGIKERGTIPHTDEMFIKNFLSLFGFSPFEGEETGTAVIIPYIDEKKLLSNNINMEGNIRIPWADTVEEYLKIAVQRWYVGRLNNPNYFIKQKQPWLKVTINDRALTKDSMAKTFQEIQKLYNMALNGEVSSGEYNCEAIKVRNYFKSTTAGHVAYKMYTAEEMEMHAPFNSPSPFLYVKNEDGTDDYKDGDIILSYFRKPGMAVAYDTAGEWVNKIKCNNEKTGDILIAIFVLNSENKFDYVGIDEIDTIEEYFRSSERADHTSWYDINVNDINPKILSKIQQQIRKKINETYKIKEKEPERQNSSLSKLFGEFLLPPEGFGKRVKGKSKGRPPAEAVIRHKNAKVTVDYKRITLDAGKMLVPITIEGAEPFSRTVFSLLVAADGKNIPLSGWQDKVSIEKPFYMDSLRIKTVQTEREHVNEDIILDYDKGKYNYHNCTIYFLTNDTNEGYGLQISSENKELLISAEITIVIRDVMAQMAYQLKGGE